ncbi:hypothetical protein JVU11DRAFT_6633 [Chiua virens]|nr:hypothetical protein JVU11DRAFT_6633 [Chiua virens]
MAFLSQCFAVLACLCAALPLALPNGVEAAHIHGSRSIHKHHSSHHGPHRTRAASVASLPTGLHNHEGKNDGHEHKQDRRSSNLPPLLRRYRVPDREEVYKYQSQEPHENVDHSVPKSAFARNRYRRGPALHSRRSSIYVPGEHGNKYIVARTPWDGFEDPGAQFSDGHNRRQLNDGDSASGRIDIMGSAQSLGDMQRLGSLIVDASPIDWSSGQSSAMAFQLNASTSNQTQFIISPIDDTTAGGQNKHVTLATEVFDADSAEMVMYCATYDSDTGSTSPLLMTPCTGVTQLAAVADDTADSCDAANASSSNPHQSQIFSYDPSSGKIELISATTSASNLASCAGAKVRRGGGNATTNANITGSARLASSTSTSTVPTASVSQRAEKVTLVYVAGAPEVPASVPSANAAAAFNVTSTARASNGQVAVLTTTTTLTTTVVSTVTDVPDASSRTVSPARAAVTVSVSPPSTPSESTTAIHSGSSSAARSATSSASETANESLEVEIVGISTLSFASSSSTSSGTTTRVTTASSSSASATLDAEAVASSIANAMPRRRRAVVEGNASIVR